MNYNKHIFNEYKRIAKAIAVTFQPFCEVVVHDLTKPNGQIIAIENSLTGRKIGDPTTNIGIRRTKDKSFPGELYNYSNATSTGKKLKSTSIAIHNLENEVIGSLCINFEVNELSRLSELLTILVKSENNKVKEFYSTRNINEISQFIHEYETKTNKELHQFTTEERKALVAALNDNGYFNLKGGISKTAKILGISRAAIYNYLNS